MHDVGQIVEEEICGLRHGSRSRDTEDARLNAIGSATDWEYSLLHCSIRGIANRIEEESE